MANRCDGGKEGKKEENVAKHFLRAEIDRQGVECMEFNCSGEISS